MSDDRLSVVDGELVHRQVGWNEWCNEAVQVRWETVGSRARDASPVVTLRDLSPVDRGTLAFGLTTGLRTSRHRQHGSSQASVSSRTPARRTDHGQRQTQVTALQIDGVAFAIEFRCSVPPVLTGEVAR